jgi:hypothetical protein
MLEWDKWAMTPFQQNYEWSLEPKPPTAPCRGIRASPPDVRGSAGGSGAPPAADAMSRRGATQGVLQLVCAATGRRVDPPGVRTDDHTGLAPPRCVGAGLGTPCAVAQKKRLE